ncbi:hypothetical protein MKW98_028161 [Papaver atlanticum]|uniref:Uncharacterized protein n=1 Tax=Papaver atlanticum TaxID=357466 RepID=A0AAD4SXB2_9MAGN|nr:hypothetical protein MKW98_028161 [Papaver atlanticum]
MTCYTHWKTKGWKHTPIIWPNKRFCGQLVSYCCAEFPELGIINSWCFTCNRSFQPTLRLYCQTIRTYAKKMLANVNVKSETRHTNESNAVVQENESDWSESRKTIAELSEIEWDQSYNCQIQIDVPIPRLSIRLRVEDPTKTTIFEASDFEFQKILRCTATDLLRSEVENGKIAVEETLRTTILGMEIDY